MDEVVEISNVVTNSKVDYKYENNEVNSMKMTLIKINAHCNLGE